MTPAQQLSKQIQERFRQMIEAHSVPVLSCWAFGLMCDQSFWISVKTDKERDRLLGDAITLASGKSRGRREAIIPIYDGLRDLLASIPKRATTVLTSSTVSDRPSTRRSMKRA